MEITSIPTAHGFVYLAAIWSSIIASQATPAARRRGHPCAAVKPAELHLSRHPIRVQTDRATSLLSAVACFEDDFEACVAHLRLPIGHRRAIRTTNLLERMFGEERRRTKAIPHSFGEKAVKKLMYAALMRARQGWRNVVVTSFEIKQIESLRDQFNSEFEQRHASPRKSASRSRIHSVNRT
jgi:hypothetical protein